jgi:hypothetical protein
MAEELEAALEGLKKLVGATDLDLDADHGRWQFYQRALADPRCLALLGEAARAEDDPALASALVVQLLEIVPDAQRDRLVAGLSPGNAEFAANRLVELRVFENVISDSLPGDDFGRQLSDWSNWLQLRIAERVDNPAYLEALQRGGRTKRIRGVAAANRR